MQSIKKGIFITLEGTEGVGKSSALHYLENFFQQLQLKTITTREPGGTIIAEKIRSILLSEHEEKMCSDTELLLMFAGRAQHLDRVIKPALLQGHIVLCDRFTDATYAYQGGGRGIPQQRIGVIEQWVQKDLQPNLTLLFDAPVELGLNRISSRHVKDRIEQERNEFFERVRSAYLERAYQHPERFKIIDATLPLVEVEQNLHTVMQEFLSILS